MTCLTNARLWQTRWMVMHLSTCNAPRHTHGKHINMREHAECLSKLYPGLCHVNAPRQAESIIIASNIRLVALSHHMYKSVQRRALFRGAFRTPGSVHEQCKEQIGLSGYIRKPACKTHAVHLGICKHYHIIGQAHVKSYRSLKCCGDHLGIATKTGYMHLVARLGHPFLLLLLLDCLFSLQCMHNHSRAGTSILSEQQPVTVRQAFIPLAAALDALLSLQCMPEHVGARIRILP